MTLVKGIVKSFDIVSYTATVQVVGSLAVWLEGVAVARNISAAEVTAGRKCALAFFDEANPKDGVVIAVYT